MASISVVVPIYKVEKYLNKCVISIMRQRYRDLEIILVDDGSNDSSGKMCDELASSLEEVDIPIYVIHQMNGGLSAARNSGIEWAMACSDSEWICFVDSDDTISEFYAEKLLNAVKSNYADLAVCDFMEVDNDGKDIHEAHSFPCEVIADNKQLFELMYENWRIHPAWNKMYRKTLFSDMRFDVGKLHEDEFIIHKVLFLSDKVVFLPDLLYFYLIRSSGIIGTQNRQTKIDAFQADINRYWFCKNNNLPYDMWVLGIDYMTKVREFKDKRITENYRKMYFDYKLNRTIKKRLSFHFFALYNWHRKRRLG